MGRTLDRLTNFNFAIGAATFPILMCVIVFNVIMRYLFSFGSIELEEIQWHLYATGFLLCLPKLVKEDGNVRIDVLYSNFSEGLKKRINYIGYGVLALPFLCIFVYFARKFFWISWKLNESSEFASGLPARYIIKFILFFAFVNIALEVMSKLVEMIKGAQS